ncbi:MAG: 30S ribosomal protein S17 [Simkania negevensis]|nr:30S ribosomal protein S17 [Simkania negevensis]
MEGLEKRKVREWIVVSNKMQKTVTVNVERTMTHPRLAKVIKLRKKYYAHNPKGNIEIGQKVRIRETRPISKLKRWIVEEIL